MSSKVVIKDIIGTNMGITAESAQIVCRTVNEILKHDRHCILDFTDITPITTGFLRPIVMLEQSSNNVEIDHDTLSKNRSKRVVFLANLLKANALSDDEITDIMFGEYDYQD